jgi:hypothetical protein
MSDVTREKRCLQFFTEKPGIFIAIEIICSYLGWDLEFAELNLKIEWWFAVL